MAEIFPNLKKETYISIKDAQRAPQNNPNRNTPRHMEVPRLGVKSELQLPVYATDTAMQDLSHVCDLHTP